jgi:hypothetical protein
MPYHYTIIGNNTIGRTSNLIGTGLNLPMAYAEFVYNTYLSPIVLEVIGIPTVLNYTKQVMRGPGLDMSDVKTIQVKFKNTHFNWLRCWVIKKLKGKCL